MVKRYNPKRQSAFTLIEIIVTIVLISISATAIMSVFTSTVRSSANPMILQQAVSIAEAYMEEILLKPFVDPDGIDTETLRSNFDDVDDYDGWSDTGTLAGYTVTVTVTNAALVAIPSAEALLVRVSVAHTILDPIVLHGYRTNY